MTRYVLCTVVTYYTRTHARPTGARFARSLATRPNLTRARPLAAATTTQRLPSTGAASACLAVAPSLRPSAAAAPAAASLLLWHRKCGNTEATVHSNSGEVGDEKSPGNTHATRNLEMHLSALFTSLFNLGEAQTRRDEAAAAAGQRLR